MLDDLKPLFPCSKTREGNLHRYSALDGRLTFLQPDGLIASRSTPVQHWFSHARLLVKQALDRVEHLAEAHRLVEEDVRTGFERRAARSIPAGGHRDDR